ncbi:MAG TPA: monovalent cation/H(+) antiporter subunit G [Methanocorpusculum sp.]|nr:monovalent cation/H(+) antiporter subunit G [Methanocorpusculum sp.]
MINTVTIVLLIISAVFSTIGIIGLFRFKDTYMRMHAGGIVGSFGFLFAGAAVIVFAACNVADGDADYIGFICHAALAIIVTLFTATTSTHIIARSAHRSGNKPKASVDALEEEKK